MKVNEHISKIINHPQRTPVSVGIVSFAAGIGLGYILARRRMLGVHQLPNQLNFDFNTHDVANVRDALGRSEVVSVVSEEDVPEIPISEIRRRKPLIINDGEEFLQRKIKVVTETDDEVVTEERIEIIREPDPEELVTKSIFPDMVDDWNYAAEVRRRNPNIPHVLHKDEFYENEKGYTQTTLTYYAGDDIMSDEEDAPVYNYSDTTGPLLFGHGSGDPKVVYVRNDKRKAEYEILNDPGKYSEEVLGLEIENNQRVRDIKHSQTRKFRPKD